MATTTNNWLALSIASGLCASLNGLFAKLVTTTLTTSFAATIARLFGIPEDSNVVEYGVRAFFFGLNLLFNGIMWALFTAALAKGSSATKVSIINTTSNFILTAFLGALVFAEKLPAMWWLGASMLVAGNVILGQKEGEDEKKVDGVTYQPLEGTEEDESRASSIELRSEGGAEDSDSSEGEEVSRNDKSKSN